MRRKRRRRRRKACYYCHTLPDLLDQRHRKSLAACSPLHLLATRRMISASSHNWSSVEPLELPREYAPRGGYRMHSVGHSLYENDACRYRRIEEGGQRANETSHFAPPQHSLLVQMHPAPPPHSCRSAASCCSESAASLQQHLPRGGDLILYHSHAERMTVIA